MTQEEKAQAYDEALEEAKKWIENPIVWNSKDICQKLFPSFVESKDERIRRKIVWCLRLIKEEGKEFLGSEPIDDCIAYLERQKEKERKPILEVFGFKVGDAVRLKDGDGRKHIIKSFEEVEGVHGPNFYHVEFEDNSARDGIYPGEEYPNGYYTQMEKFEEEQKPAEKLSEEEYVKKFKALCEAYEIKLPNREYDIYGLCEDLHKLFGDIQNPAEWSEEDEAHRDFILESLEDQIRFCKKDAEGAHYAKQIRTAQNWLKSLPERFNL